MDPTNQQPNVPTPQVSPSSLPDKKSYKTAIIILFLIIVIIVASAILFLRLRNSGSSISVFPSSSPGPTYNTYTNSEFGYTVSYSKNYTLSDVSSPSNYAELKLNKFDSVDIYPIPFQTNISNDSNTNTYTDTTNLSFADFAAKASRSYCYTQTTSNLFYCDKVISQAPTTNNQGFTGYILYLNLAQKSLNDGKITNSSFGPLYIYDVSAKTNKKLRAVLFTPLLGSQGANAIGAVKSAAGTLDVPKTP